MAELNDLMRVLGRLESMVENLRDDFAAEKADAATSRANVHRRLDDQADDIAKVRSDILIAAQVAAQAREETKSLHGSIVQHRKDVDPAIEDWKRMKTLGVGLVGLLALGGLSVGAFLTWAGETAAEAVRRWLGIG